jgi:hypothetical protein
MSQKSVTLQLPDDLYERVHEAAEASERPIETVLLESIDILFRTPSAAGDLDKLLAELSDYSNAQLWAVVYRQIPWTQSLRLRELSAMGKQSLLTDTEQTELERLIDLVDRYMLLRSEALLLLKLHGQDIDSYLKLGA